MLTDGCGERSTSAAKWATISWRVSANALTSVSRTGWAEAWKISALTSPGASIAISPSRGSCSTAAVAERVTTIISGCSRASTSRNTAGTFAAAPASVASDIAHTEIGGTTPSRSNIASMIVP